VQILDHLRLEALDLQHVLPMVVDQVIQPFVDHADLHLAPEIHLVVVPGS